MVNERYADGDCLRRICIFSMLAILWFVLLLPFAKRPAHPDSRYFPAERVSLWWEKDAVTIKVDDREERVPRTELSKSPIYQEALSRIPSSAHPKLIRIKWWGRRGVVTSWFFFTITTWWVLFRWWQPLRPYVEGGKVRL